MDHASARRQFSFFRLFVLLLSIAATGSLAMAEDYDDIYDRASLSFRTGKYEDALQLYKKANALKNNGSAECLWGLAQTYTRLGAHKNALESCDQMIKLGVNDPEYLVKAWNMRGSSLSAVAMANPGKKDVEKLREAERSFREVLKLSPASPMVHYNLGLVLLWLERQDEGLAELRVFINSGEQGEPVSKARKILENPGRASENFAPDFSGATSNGEFISSEELRGKVYLLDFWGTWCPPCRDAVPYLAKLSRKYAKDPFVLISVDVNDEEPVWREYLAKNKMNWANIRDGKGKIRSTFQVNAFPTYILVDQEGIILSRSMGGGLQTENTVESAVKKAMKALASAPAVDKKSSADAIRLAEPSSSKTADESPASSREPQITSEVIQRPGPVSSIPKPRLAVTVSGQSNLPDALRNRVRSFSVQIKNWASMPDTLFDRSKNLPACSQGRIYANSSSSGEDEGSPRLEVVIFNDRNQKIMSLCGVPRPEMLQNLMLIIPEQMHTENIYVLMRDRLTGNEIKSDPVLLPQSAAN